MKGYLPLVMLLLASSVYALPVFFDNIPVDNSFYGKGAVNFSVNITSGTLNSNNVRLFVISEDAYNNQEPWDNYTLSCIQYVADNWVCTRTLSFAVAGSDTTEFFYFSAEDSGGNATQGTSSSPLRFRIDRSGPSVTYDSPQNNSYVSGVIDVSISVSDAVSGLNNSFISLDNGPWIFMPGNSYTVNTSQYADNHTLNIRVNSTDNVGNPTVSALNVQIDNELPAITIIQPLPSEKIGGTKLFSINVTDSFSGLSGSAGFLLIGGPVSMNCNGTNYSQICTYPMDTTSLIDGNFTVLFFAEDATGNTNFSTVNVTVKNSAPSLVLSPDGFVSGVISLNASISKPEGTITSVSLSITGPTSLNTTMSCDSLFTLCNYTLNSMQFLEGPYTLLANASNTLNNTVYDTAVITIDNTKPNLTVNMPSVAKDVETIDAEVVDSNHNSNSVIFSLLGNPYPMTCLPQDNRLLCYIDFNFSEIDDGSYNVTVTATDMANNFVSKIFLLYVDKEPPELAYVTIEPLNPSTSVGVSISAVFTDKGSGVSSVKAIVKSTTSNYSITLSSENGVWKQIFYASATGSYEVELQAEDANGNGKNFSKAGYFFMGQLSCGDGICQGNENYCLCPNDCTAPKCSGNNVVNCASGLPQCAVFASCGDKVCSVGETCGTCSSDCGVCGSPLPANASAQVITESGADVANIFTNIYGLAGGNLPVIITVVVIAAIGAIVFVMKRRNLLQRK